MYSKKQIELIKELGYEFYNPELLINEIKSQKKKKNFNYNR